MKYIFSLAILLGINLLTVNVKAADNVMVWEISPTSPVLVTSNTFYRLFCETNRSYLDYYSRRRGINLAFNRNLNTQNIKFVRSGNSTGPVKYGEKIAIYVNRGGYLYYCSRTYGINLCYSTTPVYQWEIRDNSYLSNPVNPNRGSIPGIATVAIFNTHNSGYLIYGERRWGPNLKWATTQPPSTTMAQVRLSFRTGPYPFDSTSTRCGNTISWRFVPLHMTGTQGNDQPFTITRNYETTETNFGPNEWWCVFSDLFSGLKAGTWKIIVDTPLWSTQCEIAVNNGNNIINFTANKQGCRTGLSFP
jgi:hypothetical protein